MQYCALSYGKSPFLETGKGVPSAQRPETWELFEIARETAGQNTADEAPKFRTWRLRNGRFSPEITTSKGMILHNLKGVAVGAVLSEVFSGPPPCIPC